MSTSEEGEEYKLATSHKVVTPDGHPCPLPDGHPCPSGIDFRGFTLCEDSLNNKDDLPLRNKSNENSSFPYDSLTFLDLPWEQVLSYHILSPYLSIADLFHLRAVSRQCLKLVQFHFGFMHEINTSRFQNNFSAEAFKILSKDCELLRVLSVRGAKSWMSNDLLLDVIHFNPKLEKIDLTGCTSLTGASMYSIGTKCTNLKHISLRDCVWLTVDNFSSFLRHQRDIEFLDLSSCWNITDDLIVSLTMSTPSLKHLMVSNIYGLTDISVAAVAHYCPKLELLNIKGCWRITNQSILLLSQYCPNLKFLQLKECHSVTEDSLKLLRDKRVIMDRLAPPNLRSARLGQPGINLQI